MTFLGIPGRPSGVLLGIEEPLGYQGGREIAGSVFWSPASVKASAQHTEI